MSAERIRSQVQENTSGQGKGTELPDELKGLNWGAFVFNWIWGIFNKSYIALLALIPFVNLVMVFVLLFKGNKWAWANKSWDDYDHFRRVQRRWGWAALIFFILVLLAAVGGAISVPFVMKGSEPFKMGHEKLRQHPEAMKILGRPVEGSWWVTGNYKVSGPSGTADIAHSVSGPNDEGTLYIVAVMKAGQWRLTGLFLHTEKTKRRIDLLAGPDKAQLDKGIDLLNEGKNAAALALLTALAEKGDPIALYNIGVIHDEGRGVPPDDKEAVKWYLRAAAKKHALAMNNMGAKYMDGRGVPKDRVTGYMWFILAYQGGYRPAKRALDDFKNWMTPEQIAEAKRMAKTWTPENMSPVKQAVKQAVKPAPKPAMKEKGKPAAIRQLKVLAAKGNTGAQVRLGDLYLTGKGVFKNGSLAATWYQRAAEKGNALGQYKLAIMYLNGVHLPLDPKEAGKWLKKAAQQGLAAARKTLVRLGKTPPPVMKPKT